MQFSDIYKSPKSPLSRLRTHSNAQSLHPSLPEWDPDLFSRDKAKQKEAVKNYLASKIRNDWEFQWPPAQPQSQAATERDSNAIPTDPVTQCPEAHASTDNDAPAAPVSAAFGVQSGDGSTSVATHPTPRLVPVESTGPTIPVTTDNATPRDPGYEAESDAESDYSTVSEDPHHFRTRSEWSSGEDLSDDEYNYAASPNHYKQSPFRFDNPDSVGISVQAQALARRAKRRRGARKEREWNEGLACFEARRDAWTGAKTVRVKPPVPLASPASEKPLSPLSPRRLFWREKSTPTSPALDKTSMPPLALHASHSSGTASSGDQGGSAFTVRESMSKETTLSSALASEEAERPGPKREQKVDKSLYPVVTLLPHPPPLLPPDNPMRSSITPVTYNSIYEHIVLQGMSPACPVNLADMVSACVVGWKRRGEWPPRITAPEPNFARRKKKVAPPPEPARMPHTAIGTSTVQTTGGSQKQEPRRKSFSFLMKDYGPPKDAPTPKDGEPEAGGPGKTLRKSLQRVLGWHPHGHARSQSMDQGVKATAAPLEGTPLNDKERVSGEGKQRSSNDNTKRTNAEPTAPLPSQGSPMQAAGTEATEVKPTRTPSSPTTALQVAS